MSDLQRIKKDSKQLFESHFGIPVLKIEEVFSHASARILFRLTGRNHSVIVAFNPSTKEDDVFVALTDEFISLNMAVPEIYARDKTNKLVMMQDLGNVTLLDVVKSEGILSDRVKQLYRQALRELARFQFSISSDFDYSICYPRKEFDASGMEYDIKEFIVEFVGRHNVEVDSDFRATSFVDWLCTNPLSGFMYRDFQSRNIMVGSDDKLWFIDYQGGRLGPPQYDVISLLFQSRTKIPSEMRKEMLEFYLQLAHSTYRVDKEEFLRFYDGFIALRMMQVLATYGRVGLGQGKTLFLASIPPALKILEEVVAPGTVLHRKFPVLASTCTRVVEEGKKCYT